MASKGANDELWITLLTIITTTGTTATSILYSKSNVKQTANNALMFKLYLTYLHKTFTVQRLTGLVALNMQSQLFLHIKYIALM